MGSDITGTHGVLHIVEQLSSLNISTISKPNQIILEVNQEPV